MEERERERERRSDDDGDSCELCLEHGEGNSEDATVSVVRSNR